MKYTCCVSVGIVVLFLILSGLCILTSCNVIPSSVLPHADGPERGLYDSKDKVVILTVNNFNDTVLNQNRSALVEFYNTFCGHCQRYAPHYKDLAKLLYTWRETLLVAAIDCNAFENTGLCRDYEIFAYPTLRYFPPGYMYKEGNYGVNIEADSEPENLATELAEKLASENGTDNLPSFPNLHNMTGHEENALFDGLDAIKKYIIIVYEPAHSTIGLESILHFHLWPDVQVRRVTDLHFANKFQIDGEHYKLATIDRQNNIVPYSVSSNVSKAYIETIQSILDAQGFKPRAAEFDKLLANVEHEDEDESVRAAIIAEVQHNKHLVYHADLEMAIRQMLFNEIPKIHEIHGKQLLALQRILGVLQRYHPLGSSGDKVIQHMHEYVLNVNESLTGADFQAELKRLKNTYRPIFASKHFVGCVGSQRNKRGYTCSLWTLFHYLTVQAARSNDCQDTLEVLKAIHGYVKYFFGCTNCSEHFQAMAKRRKIWSVSSHNEAVLWLWAAHNEVNNRLSGDETEDPAFPKIQFPSVSSCATCRQSNASISNTNPVNNWNKDAVLSFLKNIYNPSFISHYGVESESIWKASTENLRQKRMIGNMFSEMDMRMGMLLYGFCIVMLVVAFKLFALKGYRKKTYMHDVIGKV